jgi:hypothetical protein
MIRERWGVRGGNNLMRGLDGKRWIKSPELSGRGVDEGPRIIPMEMEGKVVWVRWAS